MKLRPIILKPYMVEQVKLGVKTQHRHVLKPQPPQLSFIPPDKRIDPQEDPYGGKFGSVSPLHTFSISFLRDHIWRCPYGVIGDRLWVKENWAVLKDDLGNGKLVYEADKQFVPTNWRRAFDMLPHASRMTLEIEAVRVERLQKISAQDAKAEGIADDIPGLWNEHYATKPTFKWRRDPHVWVVKFKVKE